MISAAVQKPTSSLCDATVALKGSNHLAAQRMAGYSKLLLHIVDYLILQIAACSDSKLPCLRSPQVLLMLRHLQRLRLQAALKASIKRHDGFKSNASVWWVSQGDINPCALCT